MANITLLLMIRSSGDRDLDLDDDSAQSPFCEMKRGASAVVLNARHHYREQNMGELSVARWQNLTPSFPWIAPGWRAWGRSPRKGRDQILQRSGAEL